MANVIRHFRLSCRLVDHSNQLLINSSYCSSLLLNFQSNRGCKRSTKPPKWFVKRKDTAPFFAQKELTPENKEFLKEVVKDRYAVTDCETPLKDGPWQRHEYDRKTFRTGVLALKLGVIPQWTKDGRKFHVTMLQVLDNHVIRYTPPEEFAKNLAHRPKWGKTRMGSVVVGALGTEPTRFTKAYNHLFLEAGVPPKTKLTRFLVSPNAAIQPGTPLYATHFRVGDYVDAQAKTIGHGFQGVVKRWGMKGGPKSHGSTKFQRRVGNIGGGRDKSAVWKGRKMPGHMGMSWRTLKGLKIWRINTQYNILYVMGPNLPGPTHCYMRIYDSALWPHRIARQDNPPHMPTSFPEDLPQPLPEEMFDEKIHQFGDSSITFDQVKKSSL